MRRCAAKFILLGAALAAALALPGAVAAGHVLQVPGEHPTVIAALAKARAGDTVLVAPGRYVGPITIGDRICVIARAGADSTILDGGGEGPVVRFGEVGPETLLEGFTITGGVLSEPGHDGAGILCERGAAPRLNQNVITGNRALGQDARGGGIAFLDGANALIANSRIEGNEAAEGGGIYVGKGRRRRSWPSSPSVSANMIVRNVSRGGGGGLAVADGSEPHLVENIIAWNVARGGGGGGGILVQRSTPRIAENVVWANVDSSQAASGIMLLEYAAPRIERNIIARNRGGPGVSCEAQFQEWQDFRCNVVWRNEPADFSPDCAIYPNNLNVDPGFCDPERERFDLQPGSPCLNAADCGQIGAWGAGCHPRYGAVPGPAAGAGTAGAAGAGAP